MSNVSIRERISFFHLLMTQRFITEILKIWIINNTIIYYFAGRTHDSIYTLYRLGERLSTGARLYVETGRADGLDTDGDSPNSLHSFTGPPIPQGEGTSVTRAFLDGNHTLISIMARINPSPDWFVGVDSFQLCVEGNWVDTVTVEVITSSNAKLMCTKCVNTAENCLTWKRILKCIFSKMI